MIKELPFKKYELEGSSTQAINKLLQVVEETNPKDVNSAFPIHSIFYSARRKIILSKSMPSS